MGLKPRMLALIAFGLAVLAALFFVTFRDDPVPVDLHVVDRAPMRITVNADGVTRIEEIYDVAAPIAGTAQRAPVEVGDAVVGGETVVAVVEPIAPSLLDTRTRIQAEAAVREAVAALHVAESDLRRADEDLSYVQGTFDRVQALVNRGVSSVTQLETAAQQLAATKAARDAAQSRVDMASGSLERAEAALIEPTGEAAGNGACCVEIRAPADGVVLDVPVISTRPVQAGETLVSIGDPGDLQIVADLLSSDAVRLSAGTQATVERWGGPDALTATLRSVEPKAETKVSALGIEEQRVDAIFDLTSPPEARAALGDGFSVFLRIVEWQAADVLQVPLSALFRTDGGWGVYVLQDGVARLTPVEVGRRNATVAQILSGLEPGTEVLTHPSEKVADGVRVISRDAL